MANDSDTYWGLDGALALTTLPGEETALLTVRGKDHDLTESQLRELGAACVAAADRIATTTKTS